MEMNAESGPGVKSAQQPRSSVAILKYALVWVILMGALAGLRSHMFYGPILHDEAIFIYCGQAWADGQTPYRDFWDHKPPNIFFFHSIPLRVFPFNRTAILVHELLWLALAGTLLAAVCRMYLSWFATIAALPYFCLFLGSWVTVRSGGLTEEASLAWVALSYLFVLRGSARLLRDAFLAGLFLGVAAQFRQTFAPSSLFLAAAIIWRGRQSGMTPGRICGALVLSGLGFATPEFLWSAYFAVKGCWGQYIQGSYLFNFRYIGADKETHQGLMDGLKEHWRVFNDTGPILAAPVLALVMTPWLPRGRRWLLALALLAFVCEFIPISISGEYYHHYYIQTTVSACLLLALAAEAIWTIVKSAFGRTEKRLHPAMLAAGALAAVAVIAATAWMTVKDVQVYQFRYRAVLKRAKQPNQELMTQNSIADAIAALTKPDETIQLLGVQPNSCYFLAKRYAGSRYFHNAPIFKGKFQDHLSTPIQERMLGDLAERRPALVILGPIEGPKERWRGLEIFDARPGSAFLKPYIEENYVALEKVAGGVPQEWHWYKKNCSFLVRKDLAEEMKDRLQKIAGSV